MVSSIRSAIQFRLNDRCVRVEGVRGHDTLLDYIRLQARLTGTKEGCAEGDCGACTVLLGKLEGDQLTYDNVNACIMPLASADGHHVVTIEALQKKDGPVHPVQAAMVEHHGSQCGFCTPGFVMSLYAMMLAQKTNNRKDIEKALQGNLCRCTGYIPIIKAAEQIIEQSKDYEYVLVHERNAIIADLRLLHDGKQVQTEADEQVMIPLNLDDLAQTYAEKPHATLIAGATDVGLWITKGMKTFDTAIILNKVKELSQVIDTKDDITLGALVTYQEAEAVLIDNFPSIAEVWSRIGGPQIRNRGTIGGNVANASPIGDTPPLFIALGASLNLRQGASYRCMRLEDFFLDYGRQDRNSGEFVVSVSVPKLRDKDRLAFYKISKRKDEDISTLCGAFFMRFDNEDKVDEVRLAYGGMAGVPKRAHKVEAALKGRVFDEVSLAEAIKALKSDFSPLSDWRASSAYRIKVAENLLWRFLYEMSEHGREKVRL